MSDYSENLKRNYENSIESYTNFTKNLSSVLEKMLEDQKAIHLPIEYRTKTLESFCNKVDKPEKAQKYKKFSDVTDLSGVRIITFLQEERNIVCKIIEESFDIDYSNSIKKDDFLEDSQFGYRSTHYVVSYNKERIALPEFKKYKGLKAEIQVRTLLQHTWASIDWKLRYKNSLEAPKELRRKLYRISALLELADDEFSTLVKEISKIREDYAIKISDGNLKISIDGESMDIFLKEEKNISDIINISNNIGYSIAPVHPNSLSPYHNLLQSLEIGGIKKIEDLQKILSNSEKIEKFLRMIFGFWKTGSKPPKLVVDIGSLIRIILTISIDREKSTCILDQYPFGPELQRSIKSALEKGDDL